MLKMTRLQIIEELKDEKQRAIRMGCTSRWIDTLATAILQLENMEQIDAFMNDSFYGDEELKSRIQALL